MWINTQQSPHTRLAYERTARDFMDGNSIVTCNVRDIQRWVNSLKGSDATVHQRVAVIKSLFSFLHKTGALPLNPAVAIKVPKVRSRLCERILTIEEVTSILQSARRRGEVDWIVLSTLFYTGMRLGELLTLRWSDYRDGVLSVYGKGQKERFVTLPEWFREVFISRYTKEGDHIFPYSRSYIHKIVKLAVNTAGLNGRISAHWLRHANASIALDRGANIAVVKDTLGHASLQTTSAYVHAKGGVSTGHFLPEIKGVTE